MTLCWRVFFSPFFSTCTPLLPAQNCVDFPLSDNNLECGNENCVCWAVWVCVCVHICSIYYYAIPLYNVLNPSQLYTVSSMEYLCSLYSPFFFFFLFLFLKKGQNGEQVEWIVTTVFWFLLQWRKEKVNELLLLRFWFCYTVEQFIVLLCMRSFLGVGVGGGCFFLCS